MSDETRKLEALEQAARDIGRRVRQQLPAGIGFTLLMFEFGRAPGWTTYVSNAERADMIQVLKKMVVELEQGTMRPPMPRRN